MTLKTSKKKKIIIKNMPIKEKTKWKKISQIKVGEFIAVPKKGVLDLHKNGGLADCVDVTESDVFWDEIVAIKPVGREQVYDIEVEDTHNFVGNDIFAHNTYINMQGNVGIGTTTPTAKLQVNDSEETSFVVTSAGRVGIGTSTPSYKLSVVGDIAATAFVNISTRSSKIDIQYLTGEDEKNILDKIKSANVATYHYGIEDSANPKRLGLIAEEAPAEVLSIDGKGVDIYKLSSFILAGVKAQQVQIEDIKTRVANLEAVNLGASLPSGSEAPVPSGFINNAITVAKSTLASIASTIGDWANAALAETTKLIKKDETETDVNFKTFGITSSRDEVIASGSATLVTLPVDAQTGLASAGIKIKFDESFVSLISETENIKVILTPTSRLNGPLYVSQKTRFGFEVKEINAFDEGGTFDWMVIARKKGAEEVAPLTPSQPPSETPLEPINPVTPIEPVAPPAEAVAPPVEEIVPPATEEFILPLVEEPVVTPPAEEPVAVVEEPVTPPAETP
ncbi:MAG: hypothetical protein AAB501_01745 [Patescibacteria group bacterium]